MGLDPLELRRRNVIHRHDLPHPLPVGFSLIDVSPEETLEQAGSMADYGAFRDYQRTEPAHIRIQPDGSVDVYLGSGSHGQGLETTTAQLVSEHLGAAFDTITVHQGDTSETPTLSGPEVAAADPSSEPPFVESPWPCGPRSPTLRPTSWKPRPTTLTSSMASSRCAVLRPGRGHLLTSPGWPIAILAALPPDLEPGLDMVGHYRAETPFVFSNACHICTVEIDPVTGAVKVLRYIVSEDCGVMINPSVVEGQIAGGAIQGLGGALLEHFVYDDEGNPLTTTFLDYLLPTAADVPIIEYGHIETPASTPGHYKGVGEGGAIGAPAAVTNAVNDALALVGARLSEGPFSPARVVAALEVVGR